MIRFTTAALLASVLVLSACSEEAGEDTSFALAAAEAQVDKAIGDPALARVADLTLVKTEAVSLMGREEIQQFWTANIVVEEDLYVYQTKVFEGGAQVSGLMVGTPKGSTLSISGTTNLRQEGDATVVSHDSIELPEGLDWRDVGYALAFIDGGQNFPIFGTPSGDAALEAAGVDPARVQN